MLLLFNKLPNLKFDFQALSGDHCDINVRIMHLSYRLVRTQQLFRRIRLLHLSLPCVCTLHLDLRLPCPKGQVARMLALTLFDN